MDGAAGMHTDLVLRHAPQADPCLLFAARIFSHPQN